MHYLDNPSLLLLSFVYSLRFRSSDFWQGFHEKNEPEKYYFLENHKSAPVSHTIPTAILIMNTEDQKNFEEISKEEKSVGFLKELLLMLKHNKKWWLTPIILVLLLFGTLIIFGGSSYAPFIYTIF